jgi:hypothetical protein
MSAGPTTRDLKQRDVWATPLECRCSGKPVHRQTGVIPRAFCEIASSVAEATDDVQP